LQAIRGYIDEHQDEMIADLKAFVERKTPSEDKGLLDAFADYLAEYAEQKAGGYATVLAHGITGNQVRVEWGEHEGKPPILLLGHYDTVWPAGPSRQCRSRCTGTSLADPGSST
jgi:glutamate carboxypeptidase